LGLFGDRKKHHYRKIAIDCKQLLI